MFRSFFAKLKNGFSKPSQKDPVCGMQATDGITIAYKGQSYVFCSDHCKAEFLKNPEAYITQWL